MENFPPSLPGNAACRYHGDMCKACNSRAKPGLKYQDQSHSWLVRVDFNIFLTIPKAMWKAEKYGVTTYSYPLKFFVAL